jgi:hypothetical protein
MSEHVLKLIEELRLEVSKAEESIRPNKILANQLCARIGAPPIFTDISDQTSAASVLNGIRRNQFYGRALSTCVREFLEMRVNLPVKEATLDDIFTALKEGGYDVKSSGPTEDDQKRGLSIALGKNSQTFHRLASGDYGLIAWYPNIKEKKSKNGDPSKADPQPPMQPKVAPMPTPAAKTDAPEVASNDDECPF